jgi:CHAT domain-containing protein
MDERMQAFLSLTTPAERRAWLEQHVPTKDEAFLQALRDEVRHRKRDNPHTALPVARAIAAAAEVWQDPATQAAAWHEEAEAHRVLSEHKQALEVYKKAADLYYSLDLELEAARVAVGQFDTLMNLGLYQEALELANWAVEIFKAFSDQAALGRITMNRGNLLLRLGRLNEARASHAEARNIFSELNDARHLAMVNMNEAVILIDLDDFRQAEIMFKEARTYFESEKMANMVAMLDHNLGFLYAAQGDYQRALVTYDQSRRAFAAQKSEVDVAYVDLYRSDVYLALNLLHEALQWVQDARPVFENAAIKWETALLWLNEAVALAHLESELSPDDALDQARKIFAQEQYTIWLAMTDLYQAVFDWRRGKLDSARTCALQASEAFAREGLYSRAAQGEVVLGEVALAEDDATQAAAHFHKGLGWLKHLDVPAVAYGCWFGLGRTEERWGRLQAALDHYRRAVTSIERLQTAIGAEDYKMAFLSDKLQVYEALILICLDLNTPDARREAFETVERAKSRALLDALARPALASPETDEEASLLANIEQVKQELNWYYNRLYQPQPDSSESPAQQVARLTEAVTQREQQLARLLKQWQAPDLAATPRNPVWVATPAQVQTTLSPDTILLEFYTAGEDMIVFGLTEDELWTQRLPASCSELDRALAQLRFQINKFNYGPVYRQRHAASLQQGAQAILRRLYEVLLAPLASKLTTPSLIIVPHGLLHYVPFHALLENDRYLLEDKVISYAPSATILRHVLTGQVEGEPLAPLIMGVPEPAIPRVTSETAAIARIFPEAEVRVGEQATRQSLLSRRAPPAFLHLATHAAFRTDNPLFSSLKLADGWLNVHDIYQMQACAPLVTLSACETGRSQVAVGDELVGLCRGFFAAGARSLVVSLWLVDDESTARLMTRFYRELQAGQPANQALRVAQLALKAEMEHPYYWAAFMLTGHPQTRLPLLTARQPLVDNVVDLSEVGAL